METGTRRKYDFLEPIGDGTATKISIQVKPGKSATRICAMSAEELETAPQLLVEVGAQARDGEANEEIVRFFSRLLKLPKKNVVLITGHKNRQKTLQVNSTGEALCVSTLAEKIFKEMSC